MEKLSLVELDALMWSAGHSPTRLSSRDAYKQDLAVFQRVVGDITLRHLAEQFPDITETEIIEALGLGVKVSVQDVLENRKDLQGHKKTARELVRNICNILAIAQILRIDLVYALKKYTIGLTGEGEDNETTTDRG